MKTTTATKTAVAWMIVGGVAALAASMALGLPWQNVKQSDNPIDIQSLRESGTCNDGPIECLGGKYSDKWNDAKLCNGGTGYCAPTGTNGKCTCRQITTKGGDRPTFTTWKLSCEGGRSPDKEGKELFYDGNEVQLKNIIEKKGNIPENNYNILRDLVTYGRDCMINGGLIKYTGIR